MTIYQHTLGSLAGRPMGIRPMTEDHHFKWSSEPLCMPIPGFEPMSFVFLGKCVTHWAKVADDFLVLSFC